MMRDEALDTLHELRMFTIDVYNRFGIDYVGRSRNHNGVWSLGQPKGAIMHYTASNNAYSLQRPFGRIPALLERFRIDGDHKVGVQFIVWGDPLPELMQMYDKWPRLKDIPGLIFCTSHLLSSWHAGWANRWAYGVEVRNIGRVYRFGNKLYWNKRLRVPYQGQVISLGSREVFWEPYSHTQLACCVWLCRIMNIANKTSPELFLGHHNVSSNKIDPGPHFPLQLIRRLSCGDLIDAPVPVDWGVPLQKEIDQSTEYPPEGDLHAGVEPRHSESDLPLDNPLGQALITSDQRLMLKDLWYGMDNKDQALRSISIFRRRWTRGRRRDWKQILDPVNDGKSLMGPKEDRLLLCMWKRWRKLHGER